MVLYVQIILIAVGAFNLGIFITLLMSSMNTGDPYGAAGSFKFAAIASALMVLTSAIFVQIWIRRLAKISDSQADSNWTPSLPISTPPSAAL